MYIIYFLNEIFLLFSHVITINSKSTIHSQVPSIVYRKIPAFITGLASLCHRTEFYAHFCWTTFSAGPCVKVQISLFPFLVKWILTSMVSSPVSHPEIQFYGTDSRIAVFPALRHCRVLWGRMAEDGGSHRQLQLLCPEQLFHIKGGSFSPTFPGNEHLVLCSSLVTQAYP